MQKYRNFTEEIVRNSYKRNQCILNNQKLVWEIAT